VPENSDPRGARRSFARALRGWSGRPLALAIGWVMSCALVTAVTLTAVNRVGHEVAGSTPRVISQAGVSAQASEQSASAASAASANATVKPTAPATQSTTPPAPPPAPPAHTTSKSRHTPPPSATSAPPSSTPPPSTSPPSSSKSASPSSSPSGSSSPSTSPSTPPPSSPSSTPSASATAGKAVFQLPGGLIVMVCSGDSVANESSSVNTGYTKTDVTTPQAVDVTFTKDDASSQYVYKCRAGQAIGGIVEHP
jgi:outer membrane biosynthesis protein TonB